MGDLADLTVGAGASYWHTEKVLFIAKTTILLTQKTHHEVISVEKFSPKSCQTKYNALIEYITVKNFSIGPFTTNVNNNK
eukprot:3939380-Ditylum_brightwellii.AAC.1